MRVSGLDKHELIEFLMPTVSGFIARQTPEKIINPPSLKENRSIEILLSANKISESLDQIYFTIEMLSGYRKGKTSKMNRHDYIVFMLENFYLRITSIFDRILRFTNLVYEIGLPEKECRESTIIKNLKIKGSAVEKTLNKIHKYVNKYKPIRNQVAHQNTFHDDELNSVEGYYLLIDIDNSDDIKKYVHYYKTTADKYIIKRKYELKLVADNMKNLISEFFYVMIPIVKEDLNKY